MANKLLAFWRLPGYDQRLVMAAACWLVVASLSLRLLGLKACLRISDRLLRRDSASEAAAGDVGRAIRAVDRASRGLGFGTCLSRSLALRSLLHRRGIRTNLRIGVNRDRGHGIRAHAWLENSNGPLGDPGSMAPYRPFAVIRLV